MKDASSKYEYRRIILRVPVDSYEDKILKWLKESKVVTETEGLRRALKLYYLAEYLSSNMLDLSDKERNAIVASTIAELKIRLETLQTRQIADTGTTALESEQPSGVPNIENTRSKKKPFNFFSEFEM